MNSYVAGHGVTEGTSALSKPIDLVWIPSLSAGSGADIFDRRLAAALARVGIPTKLTSIPKAWQLLPGMLRLLRRPPNATAIIANAHIAFAFARSRLPVVAIEHHCVLDRAFDAYRTYGQAIYHRAFVRRFEIASHRTASAFVAVSQATARSFSETFGSPPAHVILNGIETDFFTPGPFPKPVLGGRPVRLLFVGNLSRRKGADLLPPIMDELGDGFELRYTAGLRASERINCARATPLGRLSLEQLRDEYRAADLLLAPTRMEGFGYAVAESLSCGTPVVATDCSSLPELVDHGRNGKLCKMNDVRGFAAAVRESTSDTEVLRRMSTAAREAAIRKFSLVAMAESYANLLNSIRQSVHRE